MSESIQLNYDHPPIVEVVASVAFQTLPSSALLHLGAFWRDSLAHAYPRIEEKAPYLPQIERFGPEVFAPQFNFPDGEFPSPRIWALNQSGDELLQLQRDWFACNWRKVSAESSYTHWPARRQAFERWFVALNDYMSEVGLGPLVPTQCEVTYINHVVVGETWKRHSELSRVFRSISDAELPQNIELESARFGHDYLINGEDGSPVGRLHVNVQPAFSAQGRTPIYVFELTARGLPYSQDIKGITDFLDQGRNSIIQTFEAISSGEIQREWGKK